MWLETLAQVATIITGLGVLFAVWQLREAKIQRLRQFEDLYIQRYWTLMDALSFPALREMLIGWPAASTEGLAPDPEESDLRAGYAYLILCEDEAELRAAGWVTDATWRLWCTYIAGQVERHPFAVAWAEVRASVPDGTGRDFQHLRSIVDHASRESQYDPCQMSRPKRLLRGLA